MDIKSPNLKKDTIARLVSALTRVDAAQDLISAIDEGITGPNALNRLTIYVNQSGGNDTTGDGTIGFPYKTIDKALASLPTVLDGSYTIKLAPGEYTASGASYIWRANVHIVGDVGANTSLSSPIELTAETGQTVVNTFSNISCAINLDLALAGFASISMINGAFRVDRADSNPSTLISISGGIFESDILGGRIVMGGYLFEDVNVAPGAELYCSNLSSVGGKINLTGDAYLKTVGGLFSAIGAMVDGTVDSGNTPEWETDGASDFGFTGSVNKTVL